MARRDGAPLWIKDTVQGAMSLRRAELRPGASGAIYDEEWLQALLHACPEVLPLGQIDAGLDFPIPLCRELPLEFGGGKSGALDNLFITANGQLILVEAKLWRNPEARRLVIAQTMEYAAAVFRLRYGELERAIMRARSQFSEQPFSSLFDLVSSRQSGLSEVEFIDAVTLNLRRGRALIAVVGDGIREDITALSELLQSHAGHRFTFALIELGVYEGPEPGTHFVTPSVLAQTALIERGVVKIEETPDGTPRISISAPPLPSSSARERSFGISEDEFYDHLEQRAPGVPNLVKSLLEKAEGLGIKAEMQSALNLKHPYPGPNPLNLATLDKFGFVDTGPSTWFKRTEIGRSYNETLAKLIGGFVREMNQGMESSVRTAAGKMPRIADFLPTHEEAWLNAMSTYIKSASANPESIEL